MVSFGKSRSLRYQVITAWFFEVIKITQGGCLSSSYFAIFDHHVVHNIG